MRLGGFCGATADCYIKLGLPQPTTFALDVHEALFAFSPRATVSVNTLRKHCERFPESVLENILESF